MIEVKRYHNHNIITKIVMHTQHNKLVVNRKQQDDY